MKMDIIEKTVEKIQSQFNAINFEDKKTAAKWLSQTYYFVNHTPKMLALAYGACQDPRLEKFIYNHFKGELGHDKLAYRDVESLGFKVSDFPELALTKAFYQSQYFFINFKNQISYLGYALFLESLAIHCGPKISERIEKQTGVKSVFLKVHAEEDIDHVEDALNFINELPQEIRAIIEENFIQSSEIYSEILKHL